MKLSGDVVVTGGAGAIGSRLVARLLDAPDVRRVVVIDDFSAGFPWLLPKSPRLLIRKESIFQGGKAWPVWLGHPSWIGDFEEPMIFHLAAHFANAKSVEEPIENTLVNVAGTVAMLQVAEKIRARLFVFASAGCATGHEDTPYQIGKTAGEAYCRYFCSRGLPTAVFRFHNSYGPGEVPGRHRNVIPRWIWAAMNGEPLTVYGDGSDARDYIYVDDVVEALVRGDPTTGRRRPYPRPLGTGQLTSTNDLARALLEAGHVEGLRINRAPRRTWDHPGAASDFPIGAAPHDAGPPVALADGLARTWAWFKENEAQIRESMRGRE